MMKEVINELNWPVITESIHTNGYARLLNCSSGKRMKKENRIFFNFEAQAFAQGYRPCGHCLKQKYKVWKNGGSV